MCEPKSHVDYRPKKNFQELQLHQALIFLSEYLLKIIAFSTKVCLQFFKKSFGFNFICVLVFFQKKLKKKKKSQQS